MSKIVNETTRRTTNKANPFNPDILTDESLLAFFFLKCARHPSSLSLAQNLLDKYGTIKNLSQVSREELSCFSGLGEAGLDALMSIFAIARRTENTDYPCGVFEPRDAWLRYGQEEGISGAITFLSSSEYFVGEKQIAYAEAPPSPKGVCDAVIESRHSRFALTLVRKRGEDTPTRSDIDFLWKLLSSATERRLKLTDLILVSRSGFYSFAASGYFGPMRKDAFALARRR